MIKRIYFILFTLLILTFSAKTQTVLFEDNFESYNVGDDLTANEAPFYVSSSEGDDSNEGTIDSPWKTLSKISTVALSPGDTVLFKKGDRFDGHFVVNGSGSGLEPIVITSYGSGDKPIITGEVGAAGGGDYQEAIFVENNDNIVFDGLEVNNERAAARAGVDDDDAYGIYIYNTGNEVMKNFIFRNMTFQNVYAVQEMNNPDDFNGLEVAAVRIASAKNKVAGEEKNIRDLLMEDCYFTDLQRLGVHIKHAGGSQGVGNDSINRNMNLIFRNNEFHYTGGTCVLPTNTYNCLIEDNLFNHPGADADPRMPNRGSSVWTWRCYNTVIQYNQCISTRGYLDSHGIHIDHENFNTFVQYNYMEDCEGGFVEILGGNVNAVYRFNVSVNDGWRDNPNWSNSNHTLWINENTSGNQIHHCDSSYIYNNTVYMDSPFSTAIDINAKNTFLYNNIFYATEGANMGAKQVVVENNGTPFFMRNNLYHGTIDSRFKEKDTNPITGDPDFTDGEEDAKNRYKLNNNSPAIDAGVAKQGPVIPGAGKGIFKDIPPYPIIDFYGNPIDLSSGTPNIGACNSKNSDDTPTGFIFPESKSQKGCLIYPNPANSIINLMFYGDEEQQIDVAISDIQGRVLQLQNNLSPEYSNVFAINLNSNITNGIYLVNIKNGSQSYGKRIVVLR